MKKGDTLREIGYFLEISDVRLRQWCTPTPCSSLREAVEAASRQVQEMDHYLKVYRQIKESSVYVASFLSVPTETRPARTVIVQITSYELLTEDEIAVALEFIKNDSRAARRANLR